MNSLKKHNLNIKKRRNRVRIKLSGSSKRPRLSVYKSNYSLIAQFIDDQKKQAMCAVRVRGKNMKAAEVLAQQILKIAEKHKIKQAVFDRGSYKYHGVVAAIADKVREGGIKI